MLFKKYLYLFALIGAVSVSNSASAYGVKLYKDSNFNQQMPVGAYEFKDIEEGYYDIQEFENDAITSLRISDGYAVELFEHSHYTGRTWIYTKDTANVGYDVNDKASAFRVYKTSFDTVTVYEHGWYNGASRQYSLGDYPSLDMNDQISSLQTPSGWLVVLYEHANFQGRSKVVNGSTGDVGDFNDIASSMRVIDNSAIGNWGGFTTSCVYNGSGESYVQYEARLWDLPWGTSWEESCQNKGAWIDGDWKVRPTGCVKDNNVNTVYTILGVAGLFVPFVPGKITTFGGTELASYASVTSASLSLTKDSVKTYSGSLSTGIWGRFLVRDDKKCNVLYSQQTRSCLTSWDGNSVVFSACENDDAFDSSKQFIRSGEVFEYTNGYDWAGNLNWRGKCLDSDYNGNVYLHECNGSNYQNWELFNKPDGAARYRSRQTGLCLDGNGWQVYTHECNDSRWQQWK